MDGGLPVGVKALTQRRSALPFCTRSGRAGRTGPQDVLTETDARYYFNKADTYVANHYLCLSTYFKALDISNILCVSIQT